MSARLGLIALWCWSRRRLRCGRNLRRLCRLGGFDVDELSLDHRPELSEIRSTRTDEPLNLIFETTRFGANSFHVTLDLRSRLTHEQLRLAVCLLANLGPELLGGNKRVVQRFVSLAKRA